MSRQWFHRELVGWALAGAVALQAAAWAGITALTYIVTVQAHQSLDNAVATRRNFYGVLRVTAYAQNDPNWSKLSLFHGRIAHGFQFQAPDKRDMATSYYGIHSGLGVALRQFQALGRPLRVGVIGLGTGATCAYARAGDDYRFYDINPLVKQLNDRYFTYLSDARARGARTTVYMGDARITLERQLKAGDIQGFDVLVVDAFTGDAIPIHLLTRESCQLYWRHLAPDGVLAVHISNRYLDLQPVVRSLAKAAGKVAVLIDDPGDDDYGEYRTEWVLVSSNRGLLDSELVRQAISPWPASADAPLLWTDDYSNLYGVLRR